MIRPRPAPLDRRRLLAVLAGAPLAALAAPARAAEAIHLTDLAGREVVLPGPARRVVLAQGRQLPALGFLLDDPVAVLAGLGGEFARQDKETFAHYLKAFPALASVPVMGAGTAETFSAEQAIAADPDLVILSRAFAGAAGAAVASEAVRQIESAGIPVVVADFYARPMTDTIPSLRLIGRALGAQERAEAYIGFYEARLRSVRERCAQAGSRPRVFLHAHAGGTDCCFSPGRGTFNDFIVAAGGMNVAADLLPGVSGQIGIETLLKIDPDVYIATGGLYQAARGGLVLGMDVTAEEAARTFSDVLASAGISGLGAVRGRRAHGLWQSFNDNPAHILAIELFAKWLHPDLFADVDPQATLAAINRFLAVPMQGTYWIDAA